MEQIQLIIKIIVQGPKNSKTTNSNDNNTTQPLTTFLASNMLYIMFLSWMHMHSFFVVASWVNIHIIIIH